MERTNRFVSAIKKTNGLCKMLMFPTASGPHVKNTTHARKHFTRRVLRHSKLFQIQTKLAADDDDDDVLGLGAVSTDR